MIGSVRYLRASALRISNKRMVNVRIATARREIFGIRSILSESMAVQSTRKPWWCETRRSYSTAEVVESSSEVTRGREADHRFNKLYKCSY